MKNYWRAGYRETGTAGSEGATGKGRKTYLASCLPYIETIEIYKGSVNSSQVRVGEIFKAAVLRNASALIVIHNHPSCAPKKHVGRKFQAESCTECAEWLEG